jgi:hypothetical protein
MKEVKQMDNIISGDALSGLLTTVGFFVALIVGRHVRLRQVSMRRQKTENSTSERT